MALKSFPGMWRIVKPKYYHINKQKNKVQNKANK